jgi:hypothetical protein
VQECNNFSHEELNNMIRKISGTFSSELQKSYANSDKDLRFRREASLDDFEKRWLKEDGSFMKSGDMAEALREAKCAEVLMLWVHHVPQAAKEALQPLVLPKLPEFKLEKVKNNTALAARYASSFSCVTGHNMKTTSTSDHKWPHWPAELHYHGKGHGAYPFWMGPSGTGGSAPIEVWWSEKQTAEKFYHSSCAMSEAGASKDAPCYHLMLGGQPNPTAYLYTASEDFCCVSGPGGSAKSSDAANARRLQSGNTEKLAPPQSDFMDQMTASGDMDFKGDFYSGTVKKYIIQLPDTEAVSYFWYLTTPEGLPVEQGEGGLPSPDDKPTQPGAGILIWHEYNTSSFDTAAIDPSVFAVPEVCKKTLTMCAFP